MMIKRYNFIEEMNKIIQSSNSMIELFRKDKLGILIKRE